MVAAPAFPGREQMRLELVAQPAVADRQQARACSVGQFPGKGAGFKNPFAADNLFPIRGVVVVFVPVVAPVDFQRVLGGMVVNEGPCVFIAPDIERRMTLEHFRELGEQRQRMRWLVGIDRQAAKPADRMIEVVPRQHGSRIERIGKVSDEMGILGEPMADPHFACHFDGSCRLMVSKQKPFNQA